MMNTIAFFVAPLIYMVLVIFLVRGIIIDNMYSTLLNGEKIKKSSAVFAPLKEVGFLILGIPFFAGIFSISMFGQTPVSTTEGSYMNIIIMIQTIVIYYVFALLGIFFHRINFNRYVKMARQKKMAWDAKHIIRKV